MARGNILKIFERFSVDDCFCHYFYEVHYDLQFGWLRKKHHQYRNDFEGKLGCILIHFAILSKSLESFDPLQNCSSNV